MDENSNRRANYVGRIQEDTQRIVRELMADNEKLRTLATTVEHENRTLQERLHALTTELDRQQQEKTFLRLRLDDFERDSNRYSEQFAIIEQRNANLANLYVSSYQLHGTLDREAVLTAIREIVINLIGSEELGVFESNDDGSFELVTSFGIDERRFSRVGAGEPLGKIAATGEVLLPGHSRPADLPPIVACLPLKLDGRVTGAIVLFSLLPHKSELQELDFELFDLLGTHAATALYCTGLHARTAARVAV
jgi:GAF domain